MAGSDLDALGGCLGLIARGWFLVFFGIFCLGFGAAMARWGLDWFIGAVTP